MLIFDFDGVLIDSVREAALTAFNSFTDSSVGSLDHLPPGYLNAFTRYRYLAHSATKMVALASWCLNMSSTTDDGRALSKSEFDLFAAKFCGDRSVVLQRKFFEARGRAFEKDKQAWFEINEPFQPIWSELQISRPEFLTILTTKNKKAVLDLCDYYNLEIKEEEIFSSGEAHSKTENFLALTDRYPSAKYLFIEDSLDNLLMFKRVFSQREDLELALASWGYVGESDLQTAAAEGIQCLSQGDLIAQTIRG